MERKYGRVCVTGGAGYVGSSLVKKLLEKGYTVHATLRNLKEKSKVGVLRELVPEANGRLVLFEADIYRPNEYEGAIQGCDFVFHVANPMEITVGGHQNDSKMSEGVIAAVKSICRYCVESGTVKRLIYTSSVVASSPLKLKEDDDDDDGSSGSSTYKDFIDETCWTPLHLVTGIHKGYIESKTLADKELLNSYYGKQQIENGLEVVSLCCGLVGGDNSNSNSNIILKYIPVSLQLLISQIKDNESTYQSLKYLEELDGKIPLVHIDDVCEAHIFCAEKENPSIKGRYLVASSYASSLDIANYYFQTYPEFHIKEKYLEEGAGPERAIKWGSTKLTDEGFVYKYDLKMILDDTIRCARRIGDL